MLEDNRNDINKCRSELVSLVTNTTDRDKCSKFIKKVSENRFTKVKEGQIRKLNSLINKTRNNKNNGIRSTGSNNNYNNRLGHNSQTQGSASDSQTSNPNRNK